MRRLHVNRPCQAFTGQGRMARESYCAPNGLGGTVRKYM
jgi:hypothetical protein